MPTALALAVFLAGLGTSLGASEILVRGLGRLGVKVGLAAGVVGLLTALGADAPEISSAITALLSGARDVGLGVVLGSNLFNLATLLGFSAVVARRIGFRPLLLWLDGGVALWATLVIGLLFLLGLAPVIAFLLIGIVFLLYVFVLVVHPHQVDGLAMNRHMRHRLAAAARLVHQDLGRSQAEELDRDSSWTPVWWVAPSVVLIVAGSFAMVNAALVLGDRWHIPHAIVGAIGLAVITSLPNAYAATRLALSDNGAAVVSLAFNSNTLNLLAGVSIPALFIGSVAGTPDAALDIAWLMAMTVLAIGLGWWREGLNRWTGLALIAAYVLFIIFAFR